MNNIALKLRYDGKNYHGWQIQKNGITVEETLTNAINSYTKENIKKVQKV